jgi:hypothetical protein
MESIGRDHPLRRMFAGLVEHAFCAEVGMCDPCLTDYMADLLVDFTHIDRLDLLRRAAGKEPDKVATMLAMASDSEVPLSQIERDRRMYRSLGDYTLFWAGIYPEQLHRMASASSDAFLDYVTQGRRSYAIVSDLVPPNAAPPPRLFRQLSDDFEYCLYGLGVVRRELVERAAGGGEGGEIVF